MAEKPAVHAAEQFRYYILALQMEGNRLFSKKLRRIDLTAAKAEVIRVLETHEPLSLKKLGELLVCEAESPSRLIDRMVAEQLILREPDPRDKRFVRLRLSESGREKARLIRQVEDQFYAELEALFGKEKLTAAAELLSEFVSALPAQGALAQRNLLSDSG